ncbi:MAG: FmdE family protein [Thiotrichales bacterium]
MSFPDFFARVPALVLRDPLAATLGVAPDGLIEYRYADAVRLAGHSCPTVAGAWLMTRHALRALYPEGYPERGALRVELRDEASNGVTGVIGSVIALVTGAAGEGGFQGLAGRFSRRGLLIYGVTMSGEVRLTRQDTGARVELSYHPATVPADPALAPLMQRLLQGEAQPEERRLFGQLWQARVQRILLEHADDAALIQSHPSE